MVPIRPPPKSLFRYFEGIARMSAKKKGCSFFFSFFDSFFDNVKFVIPFYSSKFSYLIRSKSRQFNINVVAFKNKSFNPKSIPTAYIRIIVLYLIQGGIKIFGWYYKLIILFRDFLRLFCFWVFVSFFVFFIQLLVN